MVARNDWSTAYLNGVALPAATRTLDSRLLDWSIAASYKLFGVADWSARLPTALCVLALVVVAFYFGRRLFGWNAAGLYAALLVVAWPGTLVATRDLTPIPLTCVETAVIALALWHFLVAKQLKGWASIAVTAIAAAIAALTGDYALLFLSVAVSTICWWARRKGLTAAPQAPWFLVQWIACALVFTNFPVPVPWRPFPWLPLTLPAALLVGGWLANREAFAAPSRSRRWAYAIFAVGIALGIVFIFFAVEGSLGFSLFASSIVLASAPGRIPFVVLAAAVLAGVTGNLVYRLQNNARAANCFLIGMLAGVTVAFQAGFVLTSPQSSSQILADAIRPELEPADIVAIDGTYPEASSFAFYLDRPIQLAQRQKSDTAGPPQTPAAANVDQAWNGAARVYLWTKTDNPYPVPGQSYVVAASGGKEILSNQPNSGGASF
jgi:hypothetical protein